MAKKDAEPKEKAVAAEPEPKAAPKVSSKASDMVFVALNQPYSQTFVLAGGREVTLSGNAASLQGKDKGPLPVGAFGLTRISRDDWEEIARVYSGLAIFKKGLIFASDSRDEFESEALNREDTRHGLEPLKV